MIPPNKDQVQIPNAKAAATFGSTSQAKLNACEHNPCFRPSVAKGLIDSRAAIYCRKPTKNGDDWHRLTVHTHFISNDGRNGNMQLDGLLSQEILRSKSRV